MFIETIIYKCINNIQIKIIIRKLENKLLVKYIEKYGDIYQNSNVKIPYEDCIFLINKGSFNKEKLEDYRYISFENKIYLDYLNSSDDEIFDLEFGIKRIKIKNELEDFRKESCIKIQSVFRMFLAFKLYLKYKYEQQYFNYLENCRKKRRIF